MKLRSIYPFILVPFIGIVIIATVLWSVVSTFTHATPVPGRVPIPSTIGKYTSNSKMLARTAANQPLSLAIGLNLRNQADLASYIKQITTPQSPLYHHYLNAATFAALYAPLPSSEAPVIDYLRSEGFTITATYPDHLLVDAYGTVAQAEQAFQVQINNYQAKSGQYFFANAASPSLPVSVAPFVASVAVVRYFFQFSQKTPRNRTSNGQPPASGSTLRPTPQTS